MSGLVAAGLDADELAAYELVIGRPASTLAELAKSWTRLASLATAVAALEARGFVTQDDGTEPRYTAVDPVIALEAPLADYEEQLRCAREQVRRFAARYQALREHGSENSSIEVITGHRAVAHRLAQLVQGARHDIRRLDKPPYLEGERSAADPALLRPGVAYHTIYERASVEHPGSLSDVEQLLHAGQQARMLPSLPLRLYLVDHRYAVLPRQHTAASAEAAVLVRRSALLDALDALFGILWNRALRLEGEQPATANGRRTPVDEARLTTLLLSGLTDEAIAGHLAIGYRTVQRHIATLISGLDAQTRFQAGVQVALRQLARPAP